MATKKKYHITFTDLKGNSLGFENYEFTTEKLGFWVDEWTSDGTIIVTVQIIK